MIFTRGEKVCHTFQGKEEFIFQYYDCKGHAVVVNEDGDTMSFAKAEMYPASEGIFTTSNFTEFIPSFEDKFYTLEDSDEGHSHICEKSAAPMSVAEKHFDQWYYCTDCGVLMERFER